MVMSIESVIHVIINNKQLKNSHMSRNIAILIIFLLSFYQMSQAQMIKKEIPLTQSQKTAALDVSVMGKPTLVPSERTPLRNIQKSVTLKSLDYHLLTDIQYYVKERDERQRPVWIEGFLPKSSGLSKVPMDLKAENIINYIFADQAQDLKQTEHVSEENGIFHTRYQQYFRSVPVYGGDTRLHIYQDDSFVFNGRIYEGSDEISNLPKISEEEGISAAVQDLLSGGETVIPEKEFDTEKYGSQFTTQVVWWPFEDSGTLRLSYHIRAQANYLKYWNYFVCAHTGEIIYKFNINGFVPDYLAEKAKSTHMKIPESAYENPARHILMDGPRTASATDMDNKNVTINTYELGGEFYLIDASQDMYVQNSIQQGEPKGVATVLTANNTTPYNNSLQLFYLKTSQNIWSDPVAVSAQNHTTLSYNYLKNRLNRTSLDNRGLNMETIIHYTDDKGRIDENAFWHPGRNQIFLGGGPGGQVLIKNAAGALDVVGHEYGHGVIEYTAKLIYRNQSGAINETYADIFGSMIEGRNWQLGEDVINRNNFRTGALRDMSNPRNGGNSLNDFGYQPDHVNVMYTGSEDNGGVHINSGIGNFAYYKVATRTSRDMALDIFYRALTTYLTASSEFVDFRKAAIRSAIDLYGEGQTAQIVRNAFDEVGITDSSSGGHEEDIDTNPGQDYIVLSDTDLSALYLADGAGNIITNPFSTTAPISKISFTDNGQYGVFVGDDYKVHLITIDFNSGTYNQIELLDDPVYRNAAISKDGGLLAVLAKELDNRIYVYSFDAAQWQEFTLYNYFTGPNSPEVDNVLFADVLEFTYDGQYIMYDALNDYGQDTRTWDISFIEVWDNSSGRFTGGDIVKLFNSLDEDFSIGNPTFSKNSPYIIAFDFRNEVTEDHIIYGLNLERQELGIIFENSILGYPSYSREDDKLIFDATTQSGDNVLAIIELNEDKISSNNQGRVFIENGSWGTWFSNGSRVLSSVSDQNNNHRFLTVQPNPATDMISVRLIDNSPSFESELEVVNIHGVTFYQGSITSGQKSVEIRTSDWPAGIYFVRCFSDTYSEIQKLVKLE
jgi:Zn-dependent metalloprotease